MRRHVLLLALIAALVVAIAILRPRPVRHDRPAAPPPTAHVEPVQHQEPIESSSPLPTDPKPKAEIPKAAGEKFRVPEREGQITVIDVAGEAVADAVVLVLIHPHGKPSAMTKVEEKRTNGAGQTGLRMGMTDSADVLAYKAGVGTGASGTLSLQAECTVKLLAAPALDVRCLGVHDVPLEGADIVLTTEVLFADGRDAYGSRNLIGVVLPSRKLITKLDGSGRFDPVFPPAAYKAGWKSMPGIRHRLTAEWNRMTAKLTVDKAPEGPVMLYPE